MTTENTVVQAAPSKGIKLTINEETAVVRLNEGNTVEVERNESITRFQPHLSLDAVLKQFVAEGWSVAGEHQVVKSALAQEIPVSVQEDVDEYLELHEQLAELKSRVEKKKKEVRQDMEAHNKTAIKGSFGKQVYLQDAMASNSTSRYTDFELKDLKNHLEGSMLRKVTEFRVNAEKLDGLLKSENLPKEKVEEIRNLKIANPGTPHFKVKR